MPRLEQALVQGLAVLPLAEQVAQAGEVSVGVGAVVDGDADERPARIFGAQVERVVGEAALPLLDEKLHRLELAEMVGDGRLGDADERDDLAHVQGRLGDEPEDAEPGRVTEGAVGLGERFHIRESAYLDSESAASHLDWARNQSTVRRSPSSNPTRGSHPSVLFASPGSMTLLRCSPAAGGPCVGRGPPVAFTRMSASWTTLDSRAVPTLSAPEAVDSTPSAFARATSST